jgi:hypothetical protein
VIYAIPYYIKGFDYEKDFDQQDEYQKKENAWLFGPHGVKIRQTGFKPQKSKRTETFDGLIRNIIDGWSGQHA